MSNTLHALLFLFNRGKGRGKGRGKREGKGRGEVLQVKYKVVTVVLSNTLVELNC